MKSQNIFSDIPKNLERELFDLIIKNKSVTIERIVSKGHCSPESSWYDQEKNEWVLILKGEAILAFEGQDSVHLNEGDFINIPSHKKHQVTWTDPENETIWLAVHY
ncbi:MAG: cupin domain-containing protein [Nitrosomonas sp.]|nr:cupin domain-containing protein [Nitrosomonas sp.]